LRRIATISAHESFRAAKSSLGPRRAGALGGAAAARISIAQIVVQQVICDRITTIWARESFRAGKSS